MIARAIRSKLLLIPLLLLAFAAPAYAQEQPLADKVRGLATHAKEGAEAAERNRPELMRAEYEEIHAIWASFEDQVREQDATGYVELESALDAVKDAVGAQPIDPN